MRKLNYLHKSKVKLKKIKKWRSYRVPEVLIIWSKESFYYKIKNQQRVMTNTILKKSSQSIWMNIWTFFIIKVSIMFQEWSLMSNSLQYSSRIFLIPFWKQCNCIINHLRRMILKILYHSYLTIQSLRTKWTLLMLHHQIYKKIL